MWATLQFSFFCAACTTALWQAQNTGSAACSLPSHSGRHMRRQVAFVSQWQAYVPTGGVCVTVTGICADRWRLRHSDRHMCRQVAFAQQMGGACDPSLDGLVCSRAVEHSTASASSTNASCWFVQSPCTGMCDMPECSKR